MAISIKGQKDKTWKALSRYIRLRDKHCVTCYAPHPFEDLDCGHYQRNSERNKLLGGNELWFDEINFGAQCTACNRFRNGQPVQMALFLTQKWGAKILKTIQKKFTTPKKWEMWELQELEDHYNKLADEL